MTAIDKKLAKRFEEFLQGSGAEILPVTNAWELARFRSANGICVVYQSGKGKVSYSNEYAHDAFSAFTDKRCWTAGRIIERVRRKTVEQLLIERDGDKCFYCGDVFEDDQLAPTLEHLLSRSHGGNNHLANLCLAHVSCNERAANLPIVEKIRLRDKFRSKA